MLLAACSDKAPSAPPLTITIAGSTALVPLLQEAAKRYMKDHPNVVVNLSGGGSHVGISKVAAGEGDVRARVTSSRRTMPSS